MPWHAREWSVEEDATITHMRLNGFTWESIAVVVGAVRFGP
jgi:hypothetical protein